MPSENYRYYCLNGAGHLESAKLFHAENDEDAVAQIAAKHPNDKCEIWQDQRLVAQLGFLVLENPRQDHAGAALLVKAIRWANFSAAALQPACSLADKRSVP